MSRLKPITDFAGIEGQEAQLSANRTRCHFAALPSDRELLAFVESWIDLLAVGDYTSAFEATRHDPYYDWSPGLIEAVIKGYGSPEPRRDGVEFVVTERLEARGGPPERGVDRDRVPAGSLAEVRYALPLNGEWSDLTATFRVEPADGGAAVVLQEIHVFQVNRQGDDRETVISRGGVVRLCSHDPAGILETVPSVGALLRFELLGLYCGRFGWPGDEIADMVEELQEQWLEEWAQRSDA